MTNHDPRLARYGKAIWETSRADEGTISVTGADIVASAVMAVADAEQAELRGRIEALADEWDSYNEESESWRRFAPPAIGVPYAVRCLRAALAVAPAEDATPAAPHAEDGAPTFGLISRLTCECCAPGCDCGCVEECPAPACRKVRPAPVADPSGDTEGGQA